jgi:hypothetical protein
MLEGPSMYSEKSGGGKGNIVGHLIDTCDLVAKGSQATESRVYLISLWN